MLAAAIALIAVGFAGTTLTATVGLANPSYQESIEQRRWEQYTHTTEPVTFDNND